MLENILGSLTKIRILRLFFEYPNRSFTTDEILRNSYVGRGYGGKCIKQLLHFGILKMNKVGKEKRYTLNKENKFYEPLKDLFDLERNKYPTFSYVHRNIIGDLSQSLMEETIIVFGSVAAGTATLDSDIDILIVSERESFVKKYVKKLQKKYGMKIQAIILSFERLKMLIKEKSRLLKNISKEKVFVSGDENILKMIENV
jgi:predicted nucleotidyltransferase